MQDQSPKHRVRLLCLSEIDSDWIFEVFRRAVPLAQRLDVLWVTSIDELSTLEQNSQKHYLISKIDRDKIKDFFLKEVAFESPDLEYLASLSENLDDDIWIAELLQLDQVIEATNTENACRSLTDHFATLDSSSESELFPNKGPDHQSTGGKSSSIEPKKGEIGSIVAVLGSRGCGVTSVAAGLASTLAIEAPTVLVELSTDTDLAFLHDVEEARPSLSEYFANCSRKAFSTDRDESVKTYISAPKGVGYHLLCGIWQQDHVSLIDRSALNDLLSSLQTLYTFIVCDIHPHFCDSPALSEEIPVLLTRSVLQCASHLCLITQYGSKWLYSLAKILKKVVQIDGITDSWSLTVNQLSRSKSKNAKTYKEISQIVQLAIMGSNYRDLEVFFSSFSKKDDETIPPAPSLELSALARKIADLPSKAVTLSAGEDLYSFSGPIY